MDIPESCQEYMSKFQTVYPKKIEENLLNHFVFLKDEEKFFRFYSKFDIEEENKMIINMWEQIMNYIYEEIYHCMFLTITDLIQSTKIKNKIPDDFNKIIQFLLYKKVYITKTDLNDENFYRYNFPYLYMKKNYFSGIFNFSIFNYCKSGNDNNDDNKNDLLKTEEETSVRKDFNENYLSEIIPENSIIINYKIFKKHCNAILFILNDILREEGEDIIIKKVFKDIIFQKYTNLNSNKGNIKLYYGLKLIDEALFYLKQTKQIIIFKIKESSHIEFMKISKNKDDSESEEDKNKAKKLLEDYNNAF